MNVLIMRSLMNKESILKKIKHPYFARKVKTELLSQFNHELIQKPRLFFAQNAKGKPYILTYEAFINAHPDKDEEDFWDLQSQGYEDYDEFHYDPDAQYYRRDTFLTGAAVTSVVLKLLTGEETKINDIDLFYYEFQARTNSAAEHERYNNLQGEDACYHINKVKEIGKLNLIKINIEDNFSWLRLIQTFDLNYPQVGVVLHSGELIFTDEFIDFILTKTIKVAKNFDDDFPLTSYIRAIHKSSDFNAKFYTMDVIKPYLAMDLGEEVFKNKKHEFDVTCDRDQADNEEVVLVTKKRFMHWVENPNMVPYMTPELIDQPKDSKEEVIGKLKISLPSEPWVEVCQAVYGLNTHNESSYSRPSLSGFLNSLQEVIPNFYNLKSSQAQRLKILISSQLLKIKNSKGDGYQWSNLIKSNPNILKEDFSVKQLENLTTYAQAHGQFFQNFNWFLLNNNYSLGEVLELHNHLKNWDMMVLGTLEAVDFQGSNFNNQMKYRYDINYNSTFPEYHHVIMAVLKKDFPLIKKEAEKIFLENLAKNFLVKPLNISPFAKYVKEITQADKLFQEAKRMNHCVSGFTDKIKRQESKIFHIEINGHHSTLELEIKIYNPNKKKFVFKHRHSRYQDTYEEALPTKPSKTGTKIIKRRITLAQREKCQMRKMYIWKQHQAHSNQNPHYLNNVIAKKLTDYLNQYQQDYIIEIKK